VERGFWSNMIGKVDEGDYVFIQFGHLDNHINDPELYTQPDSGYKYFLTLMINDVRDAGAIPVLVTPPVTRAFLQNGEFYDVLEDYANAMSDLASQENVALVNLHEKSKELVVSLGAENSKVLYMWLQPGEYAAYPNGDQDDTHFSFTGAIKMSDFVADEIANSNLQLKDYLKD